MRGGGRLSRFQRAGHVFAGINKTVYCITEAPISGRIYKQIAQYLRGPLLNNSDYFPVRLISQRSASLKITVLMKRFQNRGVKPASLSICCICLTKGSVALSLISYDPCSLWSSVTLKIYEFSLCHKAQHGEPFQSTLEVVPPS